MIPEDLKTHPRVTSLAEFVQEARLDRGELTLYVDPNSIIAAATQAKAVGFNRVSAVTAVDWHPQEPRFEVVYHLHSLPVNGGSHERLRLKCRLNGDAPEIDSVIPVWEGADWYEREVFDLFGIVFRGHGDLRRIMMPDDWEGHPLRKDYPVHGYKYTYAQER